MLGKKPFQPYQAETLLLQRDSKPRDHVADGQRPGNAEFSGQVADRQFAGQLSKPANAQRHDCLTVADPSLQRRVG
jgi:hypothetical protein